VAGRFGFKLFSNGERHGLGPWPMDHGSSQFTVDQRHGHGRELIGAPAPGRFRPQGANLSWGKGTWCYGGSVLPITEAWEAARRWCTGGGILAQNGDGASAEEIGGELEVWGASLGVGLPFIGRRLGEGPGCLQRLAMKEAFNAAGYWEGNEGGGHR
jgi:hypothetical protein